MRLPETIRLRGPRKLSESFRLAEPARNQGEQGDFRGSLGLWPPMAALCRAQIDLVAIER